MWRKRFKRWIWDPLGHVFRVRTIWELWHSSPVSAKVGAVLIAIGSSVWEWFLRRSLPEALAIGVALLAGLLHLSTKFAEKHRASRFDPKLECENGICGGDFIPGLGTPQLLSIRNTQVALRNLAENVTASIRYRHQVTQEHLALRELPWVAVKQLTNGAISRNYPRSVSLEGNEAQRFPVCFINGVHVSVSRDLTGPTKLLQEGNWTATVTVHSDNTDDLRLSIDFTVFRDGSMAFERPKSSHAASASA